MTRSRPALPGRDLYAKAHYDNTPSTTRIRATGGALGVLIALGMIRSRARCPIAACSGGLRSPGCAGASRDATPYSVQRDLQRVGEVAEAAAMRWRRNDAAPRTCAAPGSCCARAFCARVVSGYRHGGGWIAALDTPQPGGGVLAHAGEEDRAAGEVLKSEPNGRASGPRSLRCTARGGPQALRA